MLSRIVLLLVSCSFSFTAFSQQARGFDIEKFVKNQGIAAHLYLYDWVAWGTTDSIVKNYENEMSQLGREWFAIENKEDSSWYAIYGKLDSTKYKAVIEFKIDNNEHVTRVKGTPYVHLYPYYAKALQTADTAVMSKIEQSNVTFNSYVVRNDDETFTVYYLPAIYSNKFAVYGKEFIYTIDRLGQNIIKDESYLGESLRGYEIGKDKEINLNYEDCDVPTIGSLFYIYSFNRYYDRILIICKTHATLLSKESKTWIHIEIQKDKKKKKKK